MRRSTLALLIGVVLLDVFLMIYPPGLQCLDAKLWYSTAEVYPYFEALGESGRSHYLRHELVDLLFLAFYTAFLLRIATWLAPGNKIARGVATLPGFFDVFETAGIIVLLWVFPNRLDALASVVSVMTPLKWGAVGIVSLALVFRIAQAGYTRKARQAE
jgi:hypothetical protein